jgi:hypothetical protein
LQSIHIFPQDDKPDEKKESEGDVEMKVDEEPGKDAGDISPINGSISGLAEDGKSATKATKKAEPAFELRHNLSRVTPAQLAYITFPPEGRFQPVRAVSAKPAPIRKPGSAGAKSSSAPAGLVSEKYAGGGCILILSDLRPGEEAEFIDFAPPAPAAPEPVPSASAPALPTGPHIALDETSPEVGPPEAFEVRRPPPICYTPLTVSTSTRSITIHKIIPDSYCSSRANLLISHDALRLCKQATLELRLPAELADAPDVCLACCDLRRLPAGGVQVR